MTHMYLYSFIGNGSIELYLLTRSEDNKIPNDTWDYWEAFCNTFSVELEAETIPVFFAVKELTDHMRKNKITIVGERGGSLY